ncbi:MAG TPA: cysteine hydrolase family protein [Desulfovibrio sp.]|uniref:cysteine hydrolase family protein n=1 Tax=Desulfovibrio sp. TaxID=885 RepID=UPI002A3E08BB|nr:cysteine hydrolase family protein [Desulfovibrio sp.]MDY0305202.1 cysteine hydrolase family protein [Desulfovibrionaceae bacterium]HMM38664.1 cysteine hydrolase family protein [Desulfovibrio sp.]
MKALVIVDIQADYFPGGRMELVGSPEAAAQAARLLFAFRDKGWPVFHVRHESTRPGSTFFLPGTPGAEFHPLVQPRPGEAVVLKRFPNSFRDTPLLDLLREAGVRELVVCGMMTHMCVDATVRAAFDLGFGCVVPVDACATRTLSFQGAAIPAAQVHGAFLAALGAVYCRLVTTSECLELLES